MKRMNPSVSQIPAVLIGATLVIAGGCQSHNAAEVTWHENGQPEFTNSHETWWSHQFVYHPYADVFYEPFSQTYVWRDGEGWASGQTVPAHIELDHDTAQVVRLQQADPVVQHLYAQHTTWPVHQPGRDHASAPRSYGY